QLRRSPALDDRRREAHQHDDALRQPEGLLVGDGSCMKELYQLGETPPLGEVPRRMLAQLVRQDRFGEPTRAFKVEQVEVPPQLSWDAAAAYMLVGATAYRMLGAWPPHTVRPGDVVLVWGGAGGLGCQAIQIARAMGGIPVAVVSSDDKIEFCTRLGAKGCINRKKFSHWGMPPHWKDTERYGEWLKGARAF